MKTVLIVDDYAPNLVALELALESTDCELVAASSGREALELLSHMRVELILTDMYMKDVSGTELVRQIRRSGNNRDVPVILLSGAEPSDPGIVDATALPNVTFVQKPYTVEVLRRRMAQVVGGGVA